MEYEERVDPTQGSYIVASDRSFEDILIKKPLEVKGLTVQPGEMTSFYNWFCKPCLFVGFLDKAAIFYLGEGTSDLFQNGGFYYDQTHILTDERIFKMYSYKGGTDNLLRVNNGSYSWFKLKRKK